MPRLGLSLTPFSSVDKRKTIIQNAERELGDANEIVSG
jgi:hypothetical protein